MAEPVASEASALLDIRGLKMYFRVRRSPQRREGGTVRAVDEVSLALHQGEALGLLGDSGCGKTALARCILRIDKPTDGQLFYRCEDGATLDLALLSARELRPLRQQIRLIWHSASSLDPLKTLREVVGEPLQVSRLAQGAALKERVAAMLHRVGLPEDTLNRQVQALSDGERQRAAIARALVVQPRLVVLDEPIFGLDASEGAQLLSLLQNLQQELGLTYLFATRDPGAAAHLCQRVAVMYAGKLAEVAATDALYTRPLHPYTEALLAAAPQPDPRLRGKRFALAGDAPDPIHLPTGCYFHPRCAYVQERCRNAVPRLREVRSGQLCACHCADELNLRGVREA